MNSEKLSRLPQVLFEIGKIIGSDDSVATIFTTISELVCDLVDAEACSILLLDGSRERLMGKAAYGLARRDISGISFRVGEGVAGWVADKGIPALIDDVTDDSRYVTLPDSENRIRSLACVPLSIREERVGVLTATSSRIGAFGSDDIDVLSFIARTMALDLDNIRLRKVSVTDPLTGAYNRELLHQQLPQALEAADRGGHSLSLAMIDVDHFKSINDRFGHDVGDQVLTEVAQLLRGAIRNNDLLVRYGGEEFLLVLPRTDATRAAEIAERIRGKLHELPMQVSGAEIQVRVSVGIAEHRRHEDTPAQLIRRADSALYKAKGDGRNRVEVAT